ncbi:MAG TPA: glycosyltransferase [Chthonomonadaceae bacterium]|nr:glycosyltransferase [Chthonomonadaceae bacterium]
MLTSVGERCGIATYTRALVEGLRGLPDTTVQVVPIEEGRQPREHYVAQAEALNAPDVDVVHIQHEHSFWGGILPGKSAFWELRYLINKPVVLTAHTTYSLAELLKAKTERRPHKWLAKQILLRNTAYRDSVETAPFWSAMTIVHTAAARNELIARGCNPAAVQIVPTGVPAATPAPTGGSAFRKRFGLAGRRVVTIFGYIFANKGYELTLQAVPRLPEDVTLVIAGGVRVPGEQAYADRLGAEIAAAGLSDRVIVTGYLSDEEVAEALAASDLVLAPHTWATGSYSVTLPLTHGRPVLASDLACFQEIAGRMDAIELFRAGDAEDLVCRLTALLGDNARRTALAAGARAYAERFAWSRVASMTRRIYEQTIAIHARGHKPTWTGKPHKYFE